MSAKTDPMAVEHPLTGPVKCTAHSKQTGKPCRQYALPGTNVCYHHGGAAPQVQAAARLRLILAADTSASRLLRLTDPKNKKVPASVQLSAINSHLDRIGLKGDADLLHARVQAIQATVQANSSDTGASLITDIEIRLVSAEVQAVNGKANGHAD